MTDYVVGVDGCRGGWIACCRKGKDQALKFQIFDAFERLVDEYSDAKCIAVDIPIGLRDSWAARGCDTAARQILGRPRGSSVFAAPPRCLLRVATYAEASRKSRELFGRSLPQQTFHLMPKILEVDDFITPERQSRIFEVHPEVCFWAMAQQPMALSKKSREGYDERRTLLSKFFGLAFPGVTDWRDVWDLCGEDVSRDDVMDAAVAMWTAWRSVQEKAVRIPAIREQDGRGLKMEMIF